MNNFDFIDNQQAHQGVIMPPDEAVRDERDDEPLDAQERDDLSLIRYRIELYKSSIRLFILFKTEESDNMRMRKPADGTTKQKTSSPMVDMLYVMILAVVATHEDRSAKVIGGVNLQFILTSDSTSSTKSICTKVIQYAKHLD